MWPGKHLPFPMLRQASGKILHNRPSRPHSESKDNSHPLLPPSHTHIHNRRAVRYRNGFYSFPVCRNTHHTQHASHTHSTHSNDQLKVIHIFVVHTHFTPRPPSKKKGEKKMHTHALSFYYKEKQAAHCCSCCSTCSLASMRTVKAEFLKLRCRSTGQKSTSLRAATQESETGTNNLASAGALALAKEPRQKRNPPFVGYVSVRSVGRKARSVCRATILPMSNTKPGFSDSISCHACQQVCYLLMHSHTCALSMRANV